MSSEQEVKGVEEFEEAHDLQFINVSANTTQERKSNVHLARAHAAKINRRRKAELDRQRSEASRSASLLPKSNAASVSPLTTVPLRSRSSPYHRLNRPVGDQRTVAVRRRPGSLDQPVGARLLTTEHSTSTPEPDVPPPLVIAPTTGAIPIETFEWTAEPGSARMAHHMINTMLPQFSIDPDGIAVWFETFCKHPVFFHAMYWATAVHTDILADRAFWTDTRVALSHKASSLQCIQEGLKTLQTSSPWDIEVLIISMGALAKSEIREKHIPNTIMVLPFVPHLPTEHWQNVFGRMETVQEHARACYILAQRLGGLGQLKFPGHGENLALIDLVRACTSFEKPFCPNFWEGAFDSLLPHPPTNTLGDIVPGRAFLDIAGGLPDQVLVVYRKLSIIDLLMSQHRQPRSNESDFERLMAARSETLHDLLSLPSWQDMDEAKRVNSYEATYEICRLTTILYSNAVILGLPPHNDWHKPIVEHLRNILDTSSLHLWRVDVSGLLIWSLFVGGIAAYRQPSRLFFETYLSEVLSSQDQISWPVVRKGMKEFLWTDSACEQGAAVLWDRLELDGATT